MRHYRNNAVFVRNGMQSVPRVFPVEGTFANITRTGCLAITAYAVRDIANIH